MEQTPFMGDPLIEIARAIGRIEALVGTAMTKQTDHESRIGKLEEDATKVKTTITVVSALASSGVAVGAWMVEHFWLK